jgi:cell division septal protein FtsQ
VEQEGNMARYSTKKKPKQKPKNPMLPLFIALAGLALVFLAGFAIWNITQTPKAEIEVKGAAKIKVEKTVIDHGDIKLGKPVRDDIEVTNVGDQPLRFAEAPYIEVQEGC